MRGRHRVDPFSSRSGRYPASCLGRSRARAQFCTRTRVRNTHTSCRDSACPVLLLSPAVSSGSLPPFATSGSGTNAGAEPGLDLTEPSANRACAANPFCQQRAPCFCSFCSHVYLSGAVPQGPDHVSSAGDDAEPFFREEQVWELCFCSCSMERKALLHRHPLVLRGHSWKNKRTFTSAISCLERSYLYQRFQPCATSCWNCTRSPLGAERFRPLNGLRNPCNNNHIPAFTRKTPLSSRPLRTWTSKRITTAEPVILEVWRVCVSQRTVDPDLPCWEKGWKYQDEFQEHHLEHS